MKKIILIITLWLIISNVLTADEDIKVEQVLLGIQKTYKLEGTAPLVGHYEVALKEGDVPKNQDRWYLFAMTQQIEDEAELFGSPTKIQISKVNSSGSLRKIKECAVVG